MTRDEHLAWAKQRALEAIDAGDVTGAMTSLASDLAKHPELKGMLSMPTRAGIVIEATKRDPESARQFVESLIIYDPETAKVRIVQLLCPSRHAVMGFAYQTNDGAEDPQMARWLRQMFDDLCEHRGLNPWCGLCKSPQLATDDRPTRFKTIDEARPHLQAMEEAQARTREFFRASRN